MLARFRKVALFFYFFQGTPIVEMYSPFGKLPKYESFGKDMSEHVVFENLPDYTGTWDKMTGLISRIR